MENRTNAPLDLKGYHLYPSKVKKRRNLIVEFDVACWLIDHGELERGMAIINAITQAFDEGTLPSRLRANNRLRAVEAAARGARVVGDAVKRHRLPSSSRRSPKGADLTTILISVATVTLLALDLAVLVVQRTQALVGALSGTVGGGGVAI